MVKCDLCGQEVPASNTAIDMDRNIIACKEHIKFVGSCHTCEKVTSCAFEQDPTPIPKHVPIIQEQGNMRMQTIIRNPEREAVTCKAGCPCYSKEWGCWRTVDPSFCLNINYEFGGTKN